MKCIICGEEIRPDQKLAPPEPDIPPERQKPAHIACYIQAIYSWPKEDK